MASKRFPANLESWKLMLVASNIESPTVESAPATATIERVTGAADPEFHVSKKYLTIGYLAGHANLTINAIPPLTFNETFTAFWGIRRGNNLRCDSGSVFDIVC